MPIVPGIIRNIYLHTHNNRHCCECKFKGGFINASKQNIIAYSLNNVQEIIKIFKLNKGKSDQRIRVTQNEKKTEN
jgi:hypothetical protein